MDNVDNEKKIIVVMVNNILKDMFNGTSDEDEDLVRSVLEHRNWNIDRALVDLMCITQGCTSGIPAIDDFSQTDPDFQPKFSTFADLAVNFTLSSDGSISDENEIIIVDEEEFYLTGESESESEADNAESTAPEPFNIEQPLSPEPSSYANMSQINNKPPALLYQGYTSFDRIKRTRESLERVKLFVGKESKIMIILRGCPGSGKSSLAKKILTNCGLESGNPYWYIHSSDNYFHLNNTGTYQYDSTNLRKAHLWNQKNVMSVIHEGLTPVIVDNTNTETWEMEAYVRMAVCAGYEIEVIEPDTPWAFQAAELEQKCTHLVPIRSIRTMLGRYEYNVSPSLLLKSFNLEYGADNTPPQSGSVKLRNSSFVSLFDDLYKIIHVFPCVPEVALIEEPEQTATP